MAVENHKAFLGFLRRRVGSDDLAEEHTCLNCSCRKV
jgi:hypothetical protein